MTTNISSLRHRKEGATTLVKVSTTDITSQVKVKSSTTQGTRRRDRTIEASSHVRGKRPNGLEVESLAVSLKVMSSIPLRDTSFI